MTDRDLVERLLKIEAGLTSWELDFIESIDERLTNPTLCLTNRQREIAERIFDEKG